MNDHPTEPRSLFAVLVDRPVLALMITMALTLVGAIALHRLPLRLAPEGVNSSVVNVWVPLPTARTPRDAEEKLTRQTEDQLRTIAGLRQVRSRTETRGVRFWIQFDQFMNVGLASAEVRDRLQRAKANWPDGVDHYFTWREDPTSVPLAFFQILTPEKSMRWHHLIDDVIRPRLEAIDGVGRVDIWGQLDESVRIFFDRDKLLAHAVDYRALLDRLAKDNFTTPAGELKGSHERYLVRIDSRFRDFGEIENYPVDGALRIKDVARVERVPSVSNSLSRFNRDYTFSGTIRATSGANPVETSDRLRLATEALAKDPQLSGLSFRFMFDQGSLIKDSLRKLLESLAQGGVLALVVLFLFLRQVRATIAIAVAIPFTLLIVCGYLYFTGDTLNILTMAGMTLAVGMVVDNSVVVLENIRRLRELGHSARSACVQGTRQVGLAVTIATLTTVVVFLPMIFMSSDDNTRILFGSVGIPLSVALLASLVVALLLMPCAVRHLGALRTIERQRAPWRYSPVQILLGFNLWMLHVTLRWRYRWLLLVIVIITLIGLRVLPSPLPGLDLETKDRGPFARRDVTINMEIPRGMRLGDVVQQAQIYEDFLLQPERRAQWQIASVSTRLDTRSARFDIQLDPTLRQKDVARIDEAIRNAWPRRPGFVVVLRSVGGQPGFSEEKNERNFVLRLSGRDSEYLMAQATRVAAELRTWPEVERTDVSDADGGDEVVMQLKRDRMQDLSIRPEVAYGTVAGGLQGRELSRYQERGRELRLLAQFDGKANPTLTDVRETQIWSDRRNFQRLGDISELAFRPALASITRIDGRTTVTIVGRRANGVGPRAFSDKLRLQMKRVPMPAGYTWNEDSAANETERQMREIQQAGLLSVVLVFLLMGVLFESVILPGSILITILIAVFGALWSLRLFYGAMDVMAITGLILLAGVVVNNGIVLLDCIQRLRHDGMARLDAIHEGVRIRLRPIFMTAATTIVGLLPMALFGEDSGQGISYVSMSIAVAGGLFVCTLFAAPAVALMYCYLDDLQQLLRRTIRFALQ